MEISSIRADGHEVLVQRGAGEKAGFSDEAYAAAGAKLVDTMKEIYAQCDFVTKGKELEPCEFGLLREGQIVFTCIHPAAHRGDYFHYPLYFGDRPFLMIVFAYL